jgi:anthranilate synthase component 2
MHVLLLDNYDSFTYNLMHYIGEAGGDVDVVRNDAVSVAEVEKRGYDAIVISPGPGTPDESGICLELIRSVSGAIPLLGVCLGHQAIGQVFGGKVVRTQPMHGKISSVKHSGKSIFVGLPSPFNATRYHSLIVERTSLPDTLQITAETDNGIIMGLQHKTHNTHGVQFHPESIASEHGHAMIANFLKLAKVG